MGVDGDHRRPRTQSSQVGQHGLGGVLGEHPYPSPAAVGGIAHQVGEPVGHVERLGGGPGSGLVDDEGISGRGEIWGGAIRHRRDGNG